MAPTTLSDLWPIFERLHLPHVAKKTAAEYRTAFRRATRDLPAAPTAQDVEHWLRAGMANLSVPYRNFCLGALRRIVTVGALERPAPELVYAFATVKKLRAPPLRMRCPPPDFHARALEAAKNPAERAWLRLAGEAGLRKGELLGLRPDAIDWNAGVVHVVRQRGIEHRKNRQRHSVEVDKALIDDLRWTIRYRERVKSATGWHRGRSDGYVFPWGEKRLDAFLERIRASFGVEAARYLPPGHGWHCWRAWGATEKARSGATELEVCEWLGDADTKMAARYVEFLRGRTRAALVLTKERRPAQRVEVDPRRRAAALTPPHAPGGQVSKPALTSTLPEGLEVEWGS